MPELPDLFPGYRVEKLEQITEFSAAYKVYGPKQTWWLHRNQPNPHMLFPVPGSGRGFSSKIRGYRWFTDKDGTLRPAR